jgi:hypothetical protein
MKAGAVRSTSTAKTVAEHKRQAATIDLTIDIHTSLVWSNKHTMI